MTSLPFAWIDAVRQEWAAADAQQRMLLAARLLYCGEDSPWNAGNYGQQADECAQWILQAADQAGAAVVAGHEQGGERLAAAVFAVQDVIAAAQALAESGWQAHGEVALALEACQECAEDAALDAQAVAAIEAWPWRRLLAPEVCLSVIAEPFSLTQAHMSIDQCLLHAPPVSQEGSEYEKKCCNTWVNAIRELEGEDLRYHFKDAWLYTLFDRPLFQLTWILQDDRRTAEERMYALHALARYAHPLGWQIIAYHCLRRNQPDAEIRLQACLALCWTGRLAEVVLPQVLNDRAEDRPVRLAAARALLMLRDDHTAQQLVASVGVSDREDRRLHAVAAVARGDGDQLARLSLDGFGAPELPRWGLTALGKQHPPAHDQLVQTLLEPTLSATATLLALPIWAVQNPSSLAQAVEEAVDQVAHRGRGMSGLLLRATACLHDAGQGAWQRIGEHDKTLRNRANIALGLLGDASERLDAHLRHEDGHQHLVDVIADSQRSFAERDHAQLLLVLHTRLHPHADLDRVALAKALRQCYHDARKALQLQEKDAKAAAAMHRTSWVSGTLMLSACADIVQGLLADNPFASWSLSRFDTPAASQALKEFAQERLQQQQPMFTELLWALVAKNIDVGPQVLDPNLANNPGFWYYAMMTNNHNQEERLAAASSDLVLAYTIFHGSDQREPASLATLQGAWRHLRHIGRWDLMIDLIPELYLHDPEIVWDRLAELSVALVQHASPDLAQAEQNIHKALKRAHDPQLRTMLHGMAAMLGRPAVDIPEHLQQLLRNEETLHLRFAGQQLHTDDGKVRGTGVIELAKTFEVACRHHIASRLQGPLYDIAQEHRFDIYPLRKAFRQHLSDAGLNDIEPHCYEGRIEEVIRDSRRGVLGAKPTGANMSLGYWATALALVHQPHQSHPSVREALRQMWTLQSKRNDLAHNLHEVAKDDADAAWNGGLHAMPVALGPSSS